jgi:ligand-binding sensor domain-containing protein
LDTRKLLLLFLISIVFGQIGVKCQILLTRNYNTEDGLVSDNINSMCQDSSGFIWIATSEGLSKYDSKEFINYTTANGLSSNNLYCILTDKFNGNKIWIGTIGKGVIQYYKGKFKFFGKNLPARSRIIDCMFMDRRGRIWCGTDSSVYFIRNNKIVELHNPLKISSVNSIAEDNHGNIIIGASNGLYNYNPNKNKFRRYKLSFSTDDKIVSIKYTQSNSILALTRRGKFYLIKENEVRSILLSRIGEFLKICHSYSPDFFWVTSDHGLFKVDINNLKNFSFLNKKNGLTSDNINCVLNDREGILWLGSNGKGISKIPHMNLLRFNIPESVKNVYNVQTVIDKNNHIWIVTSDKLIELWKDIKNAWHTYTHIKLTIHSEGSLAKFYISRGSKLIITYNRGIIKEYNIANKHPFSKFPSKLIQTSYVNLAGKYKFYQIFLSMEDKEGYLWLSALDLGVVVLSKSIPRKVIKIYSNKTGLPDNSIRRIYQDKQGNYWFGGYNKGLTFFSADKVKKDLGLDYDKAKVKILKYTTRNGLPNNDIRSITENDSRTIFIGTRYGGLSILKNGKFKTINKSKGLISNGIWDVKVVPNSGVWLATQEGIQKLNFNNSISDELAYDLPKIHFYSIAFNNIEIVYANPTSIFIYNYDENHAFNTKPYVFIKQMLINGRPFHIQGKIELASSQNNITFGFISVSNKGENKIYGYRFLDKEKKWNKLVNRNFVNYASLNPGSYRFQVTTLNQEGLGIGKPVEVDFVIDSPFYEQWWFDILILLIISISIILLVKYRINRLVEIENVREKIAAELHDEIGSGLTKIAILSEHALLKNKTPDDNSSSQSNKNTPIERVGTIARNLVDQMEDVIWSINPKYDKLEDFIIHFKNYAYEVCEAKNINLKIDTLNIDTIKLNSNIKRKLQLISVEALNNSLKHSNCTHINYKLSVKNKIIQLEFSDDGKGFAYDENKQGNGIPNMKKYVDELKGFIKFNSKENHGTVIKILVPIKK